MRLAEIEGRVANLTELSRIVGAMRSIASMRLQEATRALTHVCDYARALGEGVRDVLAFPRELAALPHDRFMPDARVTATGSRALVLCMSEHGFVGGFNERLIEAAEADLKASSGTLLILGRRGAALVHERGFQSVWSAPMATRLASIPESVRRLQERLYPLIASGRVRGADVIFGRFRRGVVGIERLRLFPLAFADVRGTNRSALPPLHDIPVAQLLESLTAEYLIAQLTEVATESLAAENGARFAAMESANDNVSRKLEALRLEASRSRQEEVTTELLDLVTGEQALRSRPP